MRNVSASFRLHDRLHSVSPAQVASEHAAADSCSPTARSHLGCGVFLIGARKTLYYDYDLILGMEPETCRARAALAAWFHLKTTLLGARVRTYLLHCEGHADTVLLY